MPSSTARASCITPSKRQTHSHPFFLKIAFCSDGLVAPSLRRLKMPSLVCRSYRCGAQASSRSSCTQLSRCCKRLLFMILTARKQDLAYSRITVWLLIAISDILLRCSCMPPFRMVTQIWVLVVLPSDFATPFGIGACLGTSDVCPHARGATPKPLANCYNV